MGIDLFSPFKIGNMELANRFVRLATHPTLGTGELILPGVREFLARVSKPQRRNKEEKAR